VSNSVATIKISDLETTSAYGFIINRSDDDYSGVSVSAAGDVNGDVIIGADYANPNSNFNSGNDLLAKVKKAKGDLSKKVSIWFEFQIKRLIISPCCLLPSALNALSLAFYFCF